MRKWSIPGHLSPSMHPGYVLYEAMLCIFMYCDSYAKLDYKKFNFRNLR